MRKHTLWSLVLVFALSLAVWGQTASQISGTVTDKTGAVVPGAATSALSFSATGSSAS